MADVFISYKQEDRALIAEMAKCLESAGLSVWYDDGLEIGENFRDVINEQLDLARCILVVWSRASVKSRWVVSEALEGLNADKLVSCRIDDCEPRTPFNSLQHANLIGWDGDCKTEAWLKLVGRVKDVKKTTDESPIFRPGAIEKDIEHRCEALYLFYKRRGFPIGLEDITNAELFRRIERDYMAYVTVLRTRERRYSNFQYLIAGLGVAGLFATATDYVPGDYKAQLTILSWALIAIGTVLEIYLFSARRLISVQIDKQRTELERDYPAIFEFLYDEDDIIERYL